MANIKTAVPMTTVAINIRAIKDAIESKPRPRPMANKCISSKNANKQPTSNRIKPFLIISFILFQIPLFYFLKALNK